MSPSGSLPRLRPIIDWRRSHCAAVNDCRNHAAIKAAGRSFTCRVSNGGEPSDLPRLGWTVEIPPNGERNCGIDPAVRTEPRNDRIFAVDRAINDGYLTCEELGRNRDLKVGQFVYAIHKRIKFSAENAIFIFVDNMLPSTGSIMLKIYEENKDEDGFLCSYNGENTFGLLTSNLY
ncbi:hypothetical protein IEQ34_018220 [Dendrobium chrysotoxum]|uniref:Autophagy-related protein n=1 Tax=Dendrobium chrysotoxum TaxID=161865 RepID=A0AAV7GBS0_DENCH|nr:hypothetical protein IEQ34_018220 [Dendrobium chrysotoxum]